MLDQPQLDRLLTIPETCEWLRWGRTRVYEAIRSGALPSVRLGPKSRRVRARDLAAFIANRAEQPAQDGAT